MSSRLRCLATTSLVVSFIICSLSVMAAPAEGAHALAEKIARAHQSGQQFTEATLFAPASAPRHVGVLDEETILQPLSAPIVSLFAAHPEGVSITVKTAAGKAYTLEMLRAYPTGDRPDMGVYDALGRHTSAYTAGLHYQGALAGDDHSLATMSVFGDGEVMMLFSNEDGNFIVGKLEDGSGKYIFYNDRDMHGRTITPCATKDLPPGMTSEDGLKNAKTTKALKCNKVRIYWEVDSTLYASKGSVTSMQNYATGLFNQFQAMYANESIAVEMSSLYIWTKKSGYPTSCSAAGLYTFGDYWNKMGASFNGDLAHLLMRTATGTSGGNGGVAWLNALCGTRSNAYGYSDIYGTYNSIPTWSWDVEVITHETGHNFSSNHTHWCGWMTGSGGTCGAIDNCYALETNSCSCTTSTYSNSASTSAWQGTVMSYCHLVSRGINLANGFGPLPGDAIRNYIANSSCLSPTMSVKLVPGSICSGDGSVALQFASNHFGTSPYSYSWSNGAHTQSLSGLSKPGTYAVTVTDSNGCSQSFSTSVAVTTSTGNSIAPAIKMPVCCNNPAAPLVLHAGVPQGLSSCYSVYWLRSGAPFAAPANAQSFIDTASALNFLHSSNESSIANGATGASLDVMPASCNGPQTRYYTPVAVQLPHVADSFTFTTSGSTSYLGYSSVQIGAATTISDQSTLPTSCDLLDTPTAKTLSVTVTNYTGRANQMRILVMSVNNVMLYQSQPLTGNGAYAISASSISGNFLQGLQIIALDYNCATNYNCATQSPYPAATTCVSSQATVNASRKVVYGRRAAKLAADCGLSPAIKVDFAPSGCTKLAVPLAAYISEFALVPNPATSSVSIRFSLQQASAMEWKITDMAGRTISRGGGAYGAGRNEAQIDLRHFARGMYLVNLSDGRTDAQHIKLVVE